MSTKETYFNNVVKVPPQDLDAERALLGAIMIKPAAMMEIDGEVTPEDFYADKHRVIYQGMITLGDQNEPIDVVSLTSLLKSTNNLEKAGGAGYLAEMINSVPSASNIKHYATIVGKKSSLRRIINHADGILNLAFTEQQDLDNVFDKLDHMMTGLSNFSKRAYKSMKDELHEAWDRFEKLHQSDEGLRGVSSGFANIDAKLSGFQKSDLIILAARPSVGKTSLALDIARNAACKNNVPTMIFSLEMSSQQLVDRIIAAESHVDSWKLRTGKLSTDEDFGRIRDALDVLSKAPIYIDDEPGNNITKMRAAARKVKAEHGLGLIVVDYLQLMVPRRESDSLVQQVTEISRSLKGLARELDVPVIALSQLSRAVEQRGGKPRLSDLRDSGSIEQDADVVMFIHREDKNNENSDRKNIAEILIEKHRNGPVGVCELYFDENRVSFTNLEKSDFGSF